MIIVFDFDLSPDVSYATYKNSVNPPPTFATITASGTFQDALDASLVLGAIESGVTKTYDSVLYWDPPNLIKVNLSDPLPPNSILGMYDSTDPKTQDDISNWITFLLNGFGSVFGCPCNNIDASGITTLPGNCITDGFWQGFWNKITREFETEIGGVSTFIGPCMNPGNVIQIQAGVAPFFSVTAQVVRIRNLDRLKFLKVKSDVKACTKSLVLTLIGQTCGGDDNDNGVPTKFGIDVSMQATALGQNLFIGNEYFCDNVQPAVQNEDCAANVGCIEVFLPATLVQLVMEIELIDGESECGMEKSVRINWKNSKLSMNFSFSDRPDFWVPGLIINDDFRDQIESAMLQLANSSMRNVISNLLSEKVKPFFDNFIQGLGALTDWPFCVTFPTPTKMTCDSTVPTLPATCDLCDPCCLCLTRGDCGDLCRQDCPCILPFCTAVNRTLNPIWWFLFWVVFIIIIIATLVFIGIARGIGR